MARYRFALLTVCALIGVVSILSQWISFACVRTIGSAHYQMNISTGRLAVIRNAPWWRVESFYWQLEKSEQKLSPAEWPGFDAEVRWGTFGFEYARGDYMATWAKVQVDTEFIPPFQPVEAGTMLMYSAKVQLFMVPLWFVALTIGAFPVVQLWSRFLRARCTPRSNERS